MNRFVANTLAGFTLVLIFSMPGFAQSKPTVQQVFTGTVTCSGRITRQYACQKNQTLRSCTIDCVQNGFRFEMLGDDGRAYALEGSLAQLEKFAGGKADLTGVLREGENVILVDSVSKSGKLNRPILSGPVAVDQSAAK
jgi:hypothetical protein